MENFFYAQINSNNIVVGVSSLSGDINASDMIRITEYDIFLLGKKYENGQFIDVINEAAV
jgi:hypothetical protein